MGTPDQDLYDYLEDQDRLEREAEAEDEEAERRYQAEREANLQRWGLRPKGTSIETRKAA